MRAHTHPPRIAIVYDCLSTFGGGERIILSLRRLWPDAELFTATARYDDLDGFTERFRTIPTHTAWTQKVPVFVSQPLLYRPLVPWVWPVFDLRSYDIIISVSGANMAHAVRTGRNSIQILYLLTPPRFLYGFETESGAELHPAIAPVVSVINGYLKRYDAERVRRAHSVAAISQTVAARVSRIYRRRAEVIYPPAVLPLRPHHTFGHAGRYFLVVNRLVIPKHIDVILRAANVLRLPVRVVGNGPQNKNLRRIAGPSISFLGHVADSELAMLYANARALIAASRDEDLGLNAVEALTMGTPVVAYRSGGYTESVISGENGIFFDELTVPSLTRAIRRFLRLQFDAKICRESVKQYSEKTFHQHMLSFVKEAQNKQAGAVGLV